MRPLLPALLVSLAAASFAAPLRAQTTWVVDDDGGAGVDLTTLTAAVAAASSGDRILIHSGNYPGRHHDLEGGSRSSAPVRAPTPPSRAASPSTTSRATKACACVTCNSSRSTSSAATAR